MWRFGASTGRGYRLKQSGLRQIKRGENAACLMYGMAERTKAWQCVGCGRIESQATCMGICHDVPVEMVSAADYAALETEAVSLRAERDSLRLFVLQLASVAPRGGEWERVYRDLQSAALRLLDRQTVSEAANEAVRRSA